MFTFAQQARSRWTGGILQRSGIRLASTLSRARLTPPRVARRASALAPTPMTLGAASPLARPRMTTAARDMVSRGAAADASGSGWPNGFSQLCAATACVLASMAGLGYATNAEAAAEESPPSPSPSPSAAASPSVGAAEALATAAGVDGGRAVLKMDMRKFEDAISNTVDFRALVDFLESQHGIRIRQLIGVGSASVIFAAEKLGGGVDYGGGGATTESQLVTIKVLDHGLVRSRGAHHVSAWWRRTCLHA
jgi:hypothetical protein